MEELDLAALLGDGALDRQTIANLKSADPEAMRRLLAQHLPSEEVERILKRIRELIDAADRTPDTV